MSPDETPNYPIQDTRVTAAGVMRCCLATVAEELTEAGIGAKSQCRHCKQSFTLVARKPHPVWLPDWQIEAQA